MAPERMATAKYRRSVFHSSHDKRLTREDFERAQARATSSKGIAYRRRRRSGIFQRDLVDPTHLPPELVQRKEISIQITPSHINSSVRTNVAPSASHDATSRFEVEHLAQAEACARAITKEDACSIESNEILSSSHAALQRHQSLRASRSRKEVIRGAILERDSKGLFVSSQSEDSQDLDLHNIGEGLFGLQSPIRSPIEQPTLPRFSGRSTQPIQHESDSNFDLSQTRGSSSRHPHESHARQSKENPNARRSIKKNYKTRHRRHLAENELVLVNSRPVSNTKRSDVEMDRIDVYPFENSQDPISEPDQILEICQRSKAVGKKRKPLSKVHGSTKIKKNQTPPSTMLGYHVLDYSHLSLASADSRDMRLYCSDGFNELESVPTGRMAFVKSPRARSKLPRELLNRMGELKVVRERNFGAIKDAMSTSLIEFPQLKITRQYKTSAKEPFFVEACDHYNDEAPVDREPDLQPNSHEERLDPPLLSVNRLETKCKSTGRLTCRAAHDEGQEVTHEFISVQLSNAGTNTEVGFDEEEEMEDILEEEYETEDFEDEEGEEDEEEAANAESADGESRSSRASSSSDGRILSSQECEDDEGDESLLARNEEGSVVSEVHSEDGEGEDDVGLEFSTPRKRKSSTIIEYVTPVRQRSQRIKERGFEFEAEAVTRGEMRFPDELFFDEEQDGEGGNIIAFDNSSLLVVQGPRNLLRPIQSAPESKAPKGCSFPQPQFIDESDKVSSGSQNEETTIISTLRAPEKPNIPMILSKESHPTNPELEMRDFKWPPVDISGFRLSEVAGDLQHRRRPTSPEIMDSQSPRF